MPDIFSIEVNPTFRDFQGRFTRAEEELLDARRDELRTLGRWIVANLKAEAPRGKTGKFRESIAFRTFQDGDSLSLQTYMAQPLGTFIIEGTRPHQIKARNANALYFFWTKVGMYTVVPKKGNFKTHVSGDKLWVGKGYVDHPGTKPNDFVGRVFVKLQPEIDKSLSRISTRFVKVITGEAV